MMMCNEERSGFRSTEGDFIVIRITFFTLGGTKLHTQSWFDPKSNILKKQYEMKRKKNNK